MVLFYRISGSTVGEWIAFPSAPGKRNPGLDFFSGIAVEYTREQIWVELSKILEIAKKGCAGPELATRLHFFSVLYHATKKGDVVEMRKCTPE